MLKNYKKFYYLLQPSERKNTLSLLVLILIMAMVDVVGVASVMPFMAVLSNPELSITNKFLASLRSAMGFTSQENFLYFLGIAVLVLLMSSLALKALTNYAQVRFTHFCEHSISKRLIEGYLNQSYSWYLSRNTSNLGKNILSEVAIVTNGMMHLMLLIAQCVVAFSLCILLLSVDPVLAGTLAITLLISYGSIIRLFKKLLMRMGRESADANQLRYRVVNEAFGAVKEVKFLGIENIYIEKFSKPSETYARHQSIAHVVGQMPKFALEAIAFGGMILVVLYLMSTKGGLESSMPIITLYAFAAYRLMPAIQQIYSSLTQLSFITPSLDSLYTDLVGLKIAQNKDKVGVFEFSKLITLSEIEYSYPNSSQLTINSVNMEIPVNSSIGIVGPSGGGKSTIVDILLGLIQPQNGEIIVDGTAINSANIRCWRDMIGYVPQQIYLSDDTIAENIAFGVDPKNIDQEALINASKVANLHDFIVNDLPEKYNTCVGERGVRLSGGQRQRIGLARAMYRNPQILILDEATSALDNLTEKLVMDAVNRLHNKITVIIIAHRLTTVQECDQIYLIDKGKFVAMGTYKGLLENNASFQRLSNQDFG
jgi:ABC-type multidrug transport system fused ATPase/permease subunit